jgi:type I restriction-modification system DNA methylase subunit
MPAENHSQIASFIWSLCNLLRGPYKRNEYRKVVLPLPEQAAIAAYLDEETAKLDALVGKVEEAVERLQEYRTALITAAVTGEIDVRASVAGGMVNHGKPDRVDLAAQR